MQNNIGNARKLYARRVGSFTQEDAAAYFGVACSTYRRWEQGTGMLNGVQLSAMADKYGVTVDYLLRRVSTPDAYYTPEAEADRDLERIIEDYGHMNPQGRLRLREEADLLAESSRYKSAR